MWKLGHARCLGMQLAGNAIVEHDARGRRIVDDDFLVLLNAHHDSIDFVLPKAWDSRGWELVLDTVSDTAARLHYRDRYSLAGRSLSVLTQRRAVPK